MIFFSVYLLLPEDSFDELFPEPLLLLLLPELEDPELLGAAL